MIKLYRSKDSGGKISPHIILVEIIAFQSGNVNTKKYNGKHVREINKEVK